MKRVRMRTLGAGPEGVTPAGMVIRVSDELAERLVAGGWGEIVEDAAEPEPQPEPEPEPEQPAKAKRKPRRRSTGGAL
jgi:hypothetical protein